MTTQTTPNAIKVDTFIDAEKAAADVAIVETDLNDAFIHQPGLFFFYGSQYAKAIRQTADIKFRLELTEAKVAGEIRESARTSGDKLTEGSLKEKVALNPAVVRLEMAYNEATEVENTLRALVDAFRHRKDMLVIRGNVSRDEFKASLAIGVNDDLRSRDSAIKDRIAGRAA